MELIKLNATTSTNDYLKKLSVQRELKDFTVVWAENQTEGKGQMGTKWVAEASKNLTFSVFIGYKNFVLSDLFTLNCIVANAVSDALERFKLTNICIKWPNDILSYHKKIAGILIENNIKADGSIHSVIGIGINVLQTDFEGFPNASSIFQQYDIVIDREELLKKIVFFFKQRWGNRMLQTDNEWNRYHERLFRKGVVSTFETSSGLRVQAILKEVNRQGQLVLQLENDDLQCFNLKEIKMLY